MSRNKGFDEIDKYLQKRYSRLAEEEFRTFTDRKEALWRSLREEMEDRNGIPDNPREVRRNGSLWLRKFWPDVVATAAAVLIIFSTMGYTSGESNLAVTLRPGLSRMAEDFDLEALERGMIDAKKSFLDIKFGINR